MKKSSDVLLPGIQKCPKFSPIRDIPAQSSLKQIGNVLCPSELAAKELRSLEALLRRQKEHCPKILVELNQHGRKVSHWAWWVWPTEKEGMSEPPPRTSVSARTAPELLERAPPSWRGVLEKVSSLAAESPGGLRAVVPSIDIPRIGYFVEFWLTVDPKPRWLEEVLQGLDQSSSERRNERRNGRSASGSLAHDLKGGSKQQPALGIRKDLQQSKIEASPAGSSSSISLPDVGRNKTQRGDNNKTATNSNAAPKGSRRLPSCVAS